MKISHIHSRILVLPETDPLAGSPENPNAARPIVILRIGTDDGIEGIAVTFYGGATTRSLKAGVDDLGALIIGEDPLRLEAIIAKLRAAAGGAGPAGMFTLALAAIDIALWDIRGKALNQPLWKLLGGARERVPTYASGSLRRNLSLGEVVQAAGKLKEKGFREAVRAHMRTYQKHAMPSMMLTLPRLSLPLPCQALGREKTFPAVLRESARKALIIQGSALDIEKISRYFPVDREVRGMPRTWLGSGSGDRCNPHQEWI
jgi:hypothetical protein